VGVARRAEKMGVRIPVRGIITASFMSCISLLAGLPAWTALIIFPAVFLCLGGLQYCNFVYHTLPRDLRLEFTN